jgi:hypothetical protein
VTNEGDDTVSILLNDGSGIFNVGPPIAVGSSPRSITADDFNLDGAADLAIANQGDDTVRILNGNGDGSFSDGGALDVAAEPTDVRATRLNLDGSIDLAIASGGSNLVQLFSNDGGGGFNSIGDLAVQQLPIEIDPGDLDNDSDIEIGGLSDVDLVVVNRDGGSVSIILSNGDGTYAPAVNLLVGDEPRSAELIDMELDGDLDLAVVVTDPDLGRVVRLFRNDLVNGQINYVLVNDLGGGDGPALVVAGDVDNSGLEDLVAVNDDVNDARTRGTGDASVGVFLNDSSLPCPADVNEDGVVNVDDVLVVFSAWGQSGVIEDVNFDGIVDIDDLLYVITAWGECP